MSPQDRAIHQGRLEVLRKAARFEQETADGFEFTVDLRRMSAKDLDGWMENEQKCCSFLQMSRHIDEAQPRARVTVKCSPTMRSQVREAFGLKTTNPRR